MSMGNKKLRNMCFKWPKIRLKYLDKLRVELYFTASINTVATSLRHACVYRKVSKLCAIIFVFLSDL